MLGSFGVKFSNKDITVGRKPIDRTNRDDAINESLAESLDAVNYRGRKPSSAAVDARVVSATS